MTPDAPALIRDAVAAAHAIGQRLGWSYPRVSVLFPLTGAAVAGLDPETEERLDAYLYRFNSLFSMIQDSLFKGIAILELEDLSGKSNKDKANLMEKLGVIQSATGFSSIAILRNKLAHHYPYEAERQAERMNAVHDAVPVLLDVLNRIVAHIVDKGLLPDPGLPPLAPPAGPGAE